MISKKVICCALLLYIFPVAGCLKLIDLTKKPIDISKLSLTERKLKYEQDVETVKKTLHERHNTRHITGFSSSGTTFLYSVYTAKTGVDFDNALTAKGELFIQLYTQEQIEDCSALSIVMLAEYVSFAAKKKFIQKLLSGIYYDERDYVSQYTFTSTPKDKEIAFFTKYKECAPSVMRDIVPYMYDDNFMPDIPQEIKNCITKLLFWLQFDAQESLL